jgi:hypothetical protein
LKEKASFIESTRKNTFSGIKEWHQKRRYQER